MVHVSTMIQALLCAGLALVANTQGQANTLRRENMMHRSLSAESNPYQNKLQYINYRFVDHIDSSISRAPEKKDVLNKVKQIPVAVWLDNLATIPTIKEHLARARNLQQTSGKKVVATFVIYNLPNRDCAAAASNGELSVGELSRYKSEYIDAITKEFQAFSDISIVGVVEPDSLPNLVTNLGVQKCSAAQDVYKDGISYALRQLSSLPHVSLYLDAAHEGWLGWPNNRDGFARLVAEVLTKAGSNNAIRGLATNVANYNNISTFTNGQAEYPIDFNPAWNETSYVQLLKSSLESVGIVGKGFIIDTSRTRVQPVQNKKLQEWCNIKGAGLGLRPAVNPLPDVDAFVWVKTPGESDGISSQSSPRFDFHCSSADSFTPAPEAGEWNHDYFMELVKNASPPL